MSDETPSNNRMNRRSGELDGQQLTNYRLKSLEESVDRLTTQIANNNEVLSDFSARLLVGNERHTSYDKRLESLERDRRWTVLGILTAVGALVWQVVTAFGGPKHLPIVAACLLLTGCWLERGSPQGPEQCGIACSTLVAIGTYVVWAGSAAVSLGTLAIIASFFPWTAFLGVFRPLIGEVIALGFAAILLGSAFVWLGGHLWLIAITCGLVLAWLGYRYRHWLLCVLAAGVARG